MSDAPADSPDAQAPVAGFVTHALRGVALAEMHARPFTPVPVPRRILHFAFMPEGEARTADRRAVRAFCLAQGRPGPASGAKYHRAAFDGFDLRWEGHSEFTTYTFELASPSPAIPFEPVAASFLHLMQQVPQPGPLLVVVDLHVLPAIAENTALAALAGDDVAMADVENGAAQIITQFQADADGFVRMAIIDRGLAPMQTGALVQHVLEIETYRMLALLGLPQAQALAPAIRRIELQLPGLMDEMRESRSIEANRDLLDRLTALAAELETDASASSFRFGATRAYGDLVPLRLEAMHERAIDGRISWTAFLARRLKPAIRTCATIESRQDALSRKLARAAQLLRTRVDIDLETQNGEVLRAMNDRARLQLRLQQTVEGLSVAAISYYIASLAHHVFEGLHAGGWHIDPLIATAATVPVVLGVVGTIVWRIRRGHSEG